MGSSRFLERTFKKETILLHHVIGRVRYQQIHGSVPLSEQYYRTNWNPNSDSEKYVGQFLLIALDNVEELPLKKPNSSQHGH